MESLHPSEQLSPEKQALLALRRMKARVEALEYAQTEPIAIIGMACRFPGGCDSPEALWEFLQRRGDGIVSVPEGRWDKQVIERLNAEIYNTIRWGGFLTHSPELFDASFFGISPREAAHLDPQQRMLLEVAWEALERAGYAGDRLQPEDAGIYVGIYNSDYLYNQFPGVAESDAYLITGSDNSMASGRLSYFLNFQGPSLTLNTVCASSLVAIHLACQSLRSKACHLALAGGSNAILSPNASIGIYNLTALSPDGHCKTFDASANGFVRSEGCGMVALKRLSDALADGDNILALVRGSATNHGGRSTGLTAPNGLAQEKVIRQALNNAGVRAEQIGYVETHGTGTVLGDPIEVDALQATIGAARPGKQACILGALKSNLGHMEAAAGIGGVIKAVLCLQHGQIPPNAPVERLNPHISLENTPFVLADQGMPWPEGLERRFACVSSFGMNGTNAHLVLEESPAPRPTTSACERPLHLFNLSAQSEPALRELAGRYMQHLAAHPHQSLPDIGYTANLGRAHFAHRLSVTAADVPHLIERLHGFLSGEEVAGVRYGVAQTNRTPKIAFLFTGQGAQRVGMGKQLYETQPTFRKALDRCAAALQPYLEIPLLDVIFGVEGTDGLLDQTAYTQPALFALEYALAELWRSWGIEPAVVIGHSVGEYVAACLAGVFSLEDGIRLIAQRGKLMQALPPGGVMAAIFASEAQVSAAITPYLTTVGIAGINAPGEMVISGKGEHVEAILAALETEGVKFKRLRVSHAFHSPLMEPMLAAFEQSTRQAVFHAPQIALISNVTGQRLRGMEDTQADQDQSWRHYWQEHIRRPVQFARGMETVRAEGCDVIVEIGPQPTLLGLGQRCWPDEESDVLWLASLRAGRTEWEQMLDSLAALAIRGCNIHWAGVDQDYARRRVILPTYPFQRQRHWADQQPMRWAGLAANASSLLGRQVHSPFVQGSLFESAWSTSSPAYFAQHQLNTIVVAPAAAYLVMAFDALAQVQPTQSCLLGNVVFPQPLILGEDGQTVQLVLKPGEEGSYSFEIVSASSAETPDSPWPRHAQGSISFAKNGRLPENAISLPEIQSRCPKFLSGDALYAQFEPLGYGFGPAFRWLQAAWHGDGEILCQLHLPELPGPFTADHLHPTLLDACFQALAASHSQNADPAQAAPFVPFGLEALTLYGLPEDLKALAQQGQLWCHAHLREQGDTLIGDADLFAEDGRVIVEISGLSGRLLRPHDLRHSGQPHWHEWLYQVNWQPQPLAPKPSLPVPPGHWLILADGEGVGLALAQKLTETGQTCELIFLQQFPPQAVALGVCHNAGTDFTAWQKTLQELLARPGIPWKGLVYLWGVQPAEETPELDQLQATHTTACGGLLALVKASAALAEPPRLWVVTRGAQALNEAPDLGQSPLWGLGRVIESEHPELWGGLVDLDPGEVDLPETGVALANELLSANWNEQVAWRGKQRFVARLAAQSRPSGAETVARFDTTSPQQIEITARGDLDHLQWVALERRAPGAGEVEIEVRATGLNFRDVLNVLGMYPGDAGPLGSECSGVVVAVGPDVTHLLVGDPVVALAIGSFKSHVTLEAGFVCRKPPEMNFEEAAGLPIAFLTAYYGLHHLARLTAGERVLIHAAAGGVGMAAVLLARQAGAEIIGTAGSQEKRALLQAMGVKHVLNSRSLDFAEQIHQLTHGEGVQVVLNSLTGDYIPASLACLAQGGRFIEIGKIGIWSHAQVAEKRPDVAYHVFALDQSLTENPQQVQGFLQALMAQFAERRLAPLPYRVFDLVDTRNAFRFMSQARHTGKIVVRHPTQADSAERPLEIRSEATYLITGGLGGLGLTVARGLAARGARHLVLVGRSSPASQTVQEDLDALRQTGVNVVVMQTDVAQPQQVAHLLQTIEASLPPLRGIVHAAGVLDDGALLQQTWQRFERVMAPKVSGAWNLHRLTSHHPLDFFVMFSSATSILGTAGQGNYAAANAFLDALVFYRRQQGLPAQVINWGPWAKVGMAANLGADDQKRWAAAGYLLIEPELGLQIFEQILAHNRPQVGVFPVSPARFAQAGRPLLAGLAGQSQSARAETPVTPSFDLLAELKTVPPAQQIDTLRGYIRKSAAKVLGLSAAHPISPDQALRELGLDSLMAIELRNLLGRALGKALPPTLLFDYPTINLLSKFLMSTVLGPEAAAVPEKTNSTNAPVAEAEPGLDALAQDELVALFDSEMESIHKLLADEE
jgi:myxalamid-type polyketide synthase MxaB